MHPMHAAPLQDTQGAHRVAVIVTFCDCTEIGRNRIKGLETLPRMTDNEKSLDGGLQIPTKSQFLNSLPVSSVSQNQDPHRF